jgi:hypothetical protein
MNAARCNAINAGAQSRADQHAVGSGKKKSNVKGARAPAAYALLRSGAASAIGLMRMAVSLLRLLRKISKR